MILSESSSQLTSNSLSFFLRSSSRSSAVCPPRSIASMSGWICIIISSMSSCLQPKQTQSSVPPAQQPYVTTVFNNVLTRVHSDVTVLLVSWRYQYLQRAETEVLGPKRVVGTSTTCSECAKLTVLVPATNGELVAPAPVPWVDPAGLVPVSRGKRGGTSTCNEWRAAGTSTCCPSAAD